MSEDPKPDPYLALGLTKDATSQQIKATYRKLALKYHPDKVTDESLKASAADNFHKIQTAYETLGDDSKRAKHDANVRLEELQKAFQKEKEQSSRYRSAPAPQPMRSEARPSSYEMPPQATRGSTYPQPRAFERYETFRPRSYEFDDYEDNLPTSKPTSRKNSYFDEPKRHAPKSDEKKKHSSSHAEKERSRHDKSKRSDKEKRRDRETKDRESRRPTALDETDSDPDPRIRRHDSGKEWPGKKDPSESDESADETRRKAERAKLFATSYVRSNLEREKPAAATLRHGWDYLRGGAYEQPRRSSARSPIRENLRPERQRQQSDPLLFRNDTFPSRPPLEKHNTAPPEKFHADRERERDRDHDRDRRGKTTRAMFGEMPSLKRSETDTAALPRRPELSRGESKLRHPYPHGQPTPPISPNNKSRRYIIDEDDHTREVSPGTKPTRRARSPSPPADRERDRKTRTTSSRKTRDDAQAGLSKLKTDYPAYTDRLYDSPRSAKPPKDDKLFGEVEAIFSSRRRSPHHQELDTQEQPITYDMYPRESRRSSKSTKSRPHLSRSATQPYDYGYLRNNIRVS